MDDADKDDKTPADPTIWARVSNWMHRTYAGYVGRRAKAYKKRAHQKFDLIVAQHEQKLANPFPTVEAMNARARQIVGDWEQLKALEYTLDLDTHATLKHALEEIVIHHVKIEDNWAVTPELDHALSAKAAPVPEVLHALEGAAQKAIAQEHETLKTELQGAIHKAQSDLVRGLEKISLGPPKILALVTAFNSQIDATVKGLQDKPHDVDRRKTTATLQQAVSNVYDSVVDQFLQDFRKNEMKSLLGSVWQQNLEPVMISEVFKEKKSFLLTDISPRYHTSHTHLLDQLVNNMAFQCGPDGTLHVNARPFEEGGMFDFENAWMTPTKSFKKKREQAKKEHPKHKQALARIATLASEHMYFVDQIAMPSGVRDILQDGFDISFDAESPIEIGLLAFAAKVRRLDLAPADLRVHDFQGLSQYHGFDILKTWIEKSAARGIFVRVTADGMIYLVLRNEHSCAQTRISRGEDNRLRLMALLTIAVIERAINGAEGARALPRNLQRTKGLDIPPHCVWPLQISKRGGQATPLTSGSALARALPVQEWVPTPLENWMLGWNQLPEPNQALHDALAKRYQTITEQQVQILQAPDEVGGRGVGLDTKSTLEKMVRWFQNTSFFLCGVWLVTVGLTIWLGERYSYAELWLFSVLFFLIGFSRFLLVRTMLLAERGPSIRSKRSETWARLRLRLLNLTLGYKTGLLIGPALLLVLGICVLITGPDFGLSSEKMDALMANIRLDPLDNGAVSFRTAMKTSVWALPILTLGLLRQAFVMLSELLADRSQITRRLRTLRALETNWRIGTAAGSAKMQAATGPLTQSITRLKEKLEAKSTKAGRIFGEKSAANAAMVTLLSILGTWGSLEPNTANDSEDERKALKSIWTRNTEQTAAGVQDTDLLLASLTPLSPLPVVDVGRSRADTCAALRDKDWSEGAKRKVTPAQQTLLMVSLMDCVNSTARYQAHSLDAVQTALKQHTTTLVQAAKRLETALQDGGKGTQKTYVCLFGFGKHCVQDSHVDVSMPDLGRLVVDLEPLTSQLSQAADALDQLKGPHTATLHLDALPLADGIAAVKRSIEAMTDTKPVTLHADVTAALDTLKTLEDKLSQIARVHNGEVRMHAGNAYETHGRLLAQRRALVDPFEITPVVQTEDARLALEDLQKLQTTLTRDRQVVLTANANQIYREVGLARRALEALPRRRHVLLRGISDRPFIDINISVPTSPSGPFSGLKDCRGLAVRYFDTNLPRIRDTPESKGNWKPEKWVIPAKEEPSQPSTFEDRLRHALKDEKFVYVLGVTDGQGAPAYNLGLSQRRANHVKAALSDLETDSKIVALTIGEHGWLTAAGLPGSEDDNSYRNATVLGCDAALN